MHEVNKIITITNARVPTVEKFNILLPHHDVWPHMVALRVFTFSVCLKLNVGGGFVDDSAFLLRFFVRTFTHLYHKQVQHISCDTFSVQYYQRSL